MRVLHLTRDFPPRTTGGLSTAVGGLVRAAHAAGTDAAVLSFDGWRPRKSAAATSPPPATQRDPITGAPILRLEAPDQLDAARAFAADCRPAAVHVHHDLLWDFGAELAATLSVPALVTIHVLHAEQDRLREVDRETHSRLAQARALAAADRIVAPSEAVAALLRRIDPDVAPRLRVARLGSDPVAAPRRVDRDSRELLFVGRFADLNGTAELLAAAPRILSRAPSARLVVAGGLPENARSDRRWRRRFAELPAPLRDRVELTGWLAPHDLEARYARAAVLLAPSWFETFGQVVLEAMHRGLAIVASDTPALAELVTDEQSALIVPPRDPDALAAAALRLLGDPALATRLASAAAETAATFAWSRRIDEHLAIYRELAATRRPRDG